MPWGWGVESVAMAPALPIFATAPDAIRAGLNWMHPHNNVIQIAAEMGLPGVGLGCAASLAVAWWIQADARLVPARAALAAAILTVALVSHGFWQMWFWSAAAVGVLALRTRSP
jgi:O-antigen ligase